jgi:hypothetical protein
MATYIDFSKIYTISNRPRIMLRFLTSYIGEEWDTSGNNPRLEKENCKESKESKKSNSINDGGLMKNIQFTLDTVDTQQSGRSIK